MPKLPGWMVEILNPQDPNFKISKNHRDEYLYVEGEHKAIIEALRIIGEDVDRSVRPRSLHHWEPPFENEAINAEKKEIILSRLNNYLTVRGIKFEVDPP